MLFCRHNYTHQFIHTSDSKQQLHQLWSTYPWVHWSASSDPKCSWWNALCCLSRRSGPLSCRADSCRCIRSVWALQWSVWSTRLASLTTTHAADCWSGCGSGRLTGPPRWRPPWCNYLLQALRWWTPTRCRSKRNQSLIIHCWREFCSCDSNFAWQLLWTIAGNRNTRARKHQACLWPPSLTGTALCRPSLWPSWSTVWWWGSLRRAARSRAAAPCWDWNSSPWLPCFRSSQ